MTLEPIIREQNAAYRTVPDPEDTLEVELKTPAGESVHGEIADVSSTGASVLFSREVAPALAMGKSVILLFTTPLLPKPFEVCGNLVRRSELETSRQYAFKFVKELLLRDPNLQRLFNLRSAYRVAPGQDEIIEVILRPIVNDHTQTLLLARCIDISVIAIGLETDTAMDAALRDVEIVEVSFELPDSKTKQTLLARIMNRRLADGKVEYGLQFDTEQSPDHSNQLEHIITYVMRRQQEELQQTAQSRP